MDTIDLSPSIAAETISPADHGSPFRLENESAYQAWRQSKLQARQHSEALRIFRLDPANSIASESRQQLLLNLQAHNFILFETTDELGKTEFVELNRQLGLKQLDPADADEAVSSLQVLDSDDRRSRYIPYSNRALNWHTDGYYNSGSHRLNAFALYCVRQAHSGGGNFLFDHEMMYLLIRDQSPDLLVALMSPELMLVPANIEAGRVTRAAESGPVFSVNQLNGELNMRYTSRPQNIVWKSDRLSQQALNLVRELLMDSEAIVECRLEQRQGIICNNLLHGRQAFQDAANGPGRLFYRARYYDSIKPAWPAA